MAVTVIVPAILSAILCDLSSVPINDLCSD